MERLALLALLLHTIASLPGATAIAQQLRELPGSMARVKRQSSTDDPNQTPSDSIYVNYPACDSFKCSVNWPQGLSTYVNWYNPPVSGNVSVMLNSSSGGENYTIATVPSISQTGYCDAGGGNGVVIPGKTCGRVEFVVPLSWKTGNYSVAVTSLVNTSIAGFTDFVIIAAPNSSDFSSAAASASSAQGGATTAVLETISGPTSTDSADSTKYSGPSTPEPTAGLAVSTGAASAAGSSAGAGSPAASRAASSGAALSSGVASSASSASSPAASSSASSSAGTAVRSKITIA